MKSKQKTERQKFIDERDSKILELVAFEKRHGAKLARSAMRKHLTLATARDSKNKQIRKLEQELAKLK